jgi:hypothetical protein
MLSSLTPNQPPAGSNLELVRALAPRLWRTSAYSQAELYASFGAELDLEERNSAREVAER